MSKRKILKAAQNFLRNSKSGKVHLILFNPQSEETHKTLSKFQTSFLSLKLLNLFSFHLSSMMSKSNIE